MWRNLILFQILSGFQDMTARELNNKKRNISNTTYKITGGKGNTNNLLFKKTTL
jgi:hypothetical protein